MTSPLAFQNALNHYQMISLSQEMWFDLQWSNWMTRPTNVQRDIVFHVQ